MRNFKGQTGQVLALGLLMMMVLVMAWSKYYQTGVTTAAKTRLVHGLDAAAYSGAAVQARTLNLLSYLNRAQIAHQIALAHLISIGSWAHYGASQAQRLAQANPPVHLISMFFGAAHGKAYTAAAQALNLQNLVKGSGDLAVAFKNHDDFIHTEVKSLAQYLVKEMPNIRLATIKSVLAAHYAELEPSQIEPKVMQDEWPELLALNPVDADLFNLVKKVAALYEFLDERNYTKKNSWSVDSRCPSRRHQLRRRGNTNMDQIGRWQSSDTQSLHAVRSNRWVGCYYREYSMGWAWFPAGTNQAIDAWFVDNPPDDFSKQDFWRWVDAVNKWSLLDTSANPLSNSYAMRDAIKWSAKGLSPYFDVTTNDKKRAASGFVLTMDLEQAEGPVLHATSSAETFFLRPEQRADKKAELANLFHPYWQAHLSNTFIQISRW